jgi:hypothetical protein
MHTLLSTSADVLIFILLAWGIWRLLRRSIPISVVPIVIGLVLAAQAGCPHIWACRGWWATSWGGSA